MSKPLPPIRAAEAIVYPLITAQGEPAKIEAATAEADGKPASPPKLSANSYNGGPLRLNGYDMPVVVDLDHLQGLDKEHAIYRDHDRNRILGSGRTTRAVNSLHTTGSLTNETPDVAEVVLLGKAKFPFEASFGVLPLGLVRVPKGKTEVVNGQTVTGPLYIARPSKLKEVSLVNHGADDSTSLHIAATLPLKEFVMGFEAWLTAKGFIKAELSESQLKALQAMFDAESKGDTKDKTTPSVDAVLQAARDKEKKQAAFGTIISSAIDRGMDTTTAERLVQAASNDNLTETEFELQVLRATRHEGSSRAASSHGSDNPEIIEAAIARQIGGDLEAAYKPEVLEASERQFRFGLSLIEAISLSARRNGYSAVSHRDLKPLLRAAFAPVQAAGASTYDLGGVLSNVANKMIRAGFDSVESEWRKVAAIRAVNDLKEHKSYALTGDFTYKEVGKGGEITHAKMSEEEYSNRAKTYARMFAITEDDLINDDLGAFTRVRNLVGRGAAIKFNTVFWTEFLAAVTAFYTTGRKNYFEGATSALDVDSLSTGFTMFESQVDPDDNPLGLAPGVLVVPTALKIAGNRLVKDPEIRVDGASAKTTYTTSNPHAGTVELAASTYLNNVNIPNGSATHWFLLANPMDMPLIEACFLYGQQEPRIQSADADFDTLGIQMRGTYRFGVAKQEFRAGVRSKGAA